MLKFSVIGFEMVKYLHQLNVLLLAALPVFMQVGELFKVAGSAFIQLGDLTTELHVSNEQTATR